jgi:hypothetical protein
VPLKWLAPAAQLVSSMDRQRALHAGASHQTSCALRRLDLPQGHDQSIQPRAKGPDKGLQAKNEAGINRILTCSAEMNLRRIGLSNLLAQQFHKRRRDDPVLCSPLSKRCNLWRKFGARFADPRRGLSRDHAKSRLRAGQRLLEGEHRANVRFDRKRAGDLFIAQKR